MLVKNWMTQPVITIDKSDTIGLATQLMTENRIRTIPVVSEGKLVGIISDRDLKKVSVSGGTGLEAPKVAYFNTRVKVGSFMTKDVITVSPDTTVDEVAKIMMDKKISGIPVVESSGELVGIITQGNIFKLLISLTGIESEGTQVAVEISTETGSVKQVADAIRGVGGRIGALLTSYENVPEGFRHAYFKAYDLNEENVKELIANLEGKVKILYVFEHAGDMTPPKIMLMNI